jgi:sec-independent protein translocase protein TatA
MFRNPVTDSIVALVILLLIFGPKRLPLLGRSLGQGMREFKDSITGNSSSEDDDPERPAVTEGSAAPAAPAPPAPPAAAPPTSTPPEATAEPVAPAPPIEAAAAQMPPVASSDRPS